MKRRFLRRAGQRAVLAQLYMKHPDATIVAGATDVGLWITKKLTPLEKIIHVGRVAELGAIEESATGFEFGAIVSLTRAAPALGSIDPDVAEVLRRFGSMQVRAAGTVGGNIANGSPIGDLAPMLIALDATLELRRGDQVRTLAAGKFLSRLRQTGSPAGRICAPPFGAEALRRVGISAPTKSPSVSTRIFPRCSRRFA